MEQQDFVAKPVAFRAGELKKLTVEISDTAREVLRGSRRPEFVRLLDADPEKARAAALARVQVYLEGRVPTKE